MGKFVEYFKQKKNLANLLILGILVLAVPVGIKILQQQQIIKSRATADPVVFTGDNVTQQDGKWVAKKPQISLELISPLGPPPGSNPPVSPAPSGSSSSSCPNKLIFGLGGPMSDKIKELYTKPSINFFAVAWGDIQPTVDSSYNFSTMDQAVDESIRDEKIPAVRFCDGDCFPNWARQMDKDVDKPYCCTSDYVCRVLKDDSTIVSAFQAVVRAMVTKYKDKIHEWDYGLEPNCRGYSPSLYTRWLGYFAEAVRSADPSAVVIGGHLAGGNNDYLRSMYENGARSYFDKIVLDPYGVPLDYSAIEGARNIMVANGDENKKIWLGEWGIPSENDEGRQANLIGEGLDYLAGKSWIEAAFYHNYECELSVPNCSPGSQGYLGFSLIRSNGTTKPSFDVFKNKIAACIAR